MKNKLTKKKRKKRGGGGAIKKIFLKKNKIIYKKFGAIHLNFPPPFYKKCQNFD